MAYAANRHPGVRAAVAWTPEVARLARAHNDANVLVLPARFVTEDEGVEILKTWLDTPFEGGRHARRVAKIEQEHGMTLDHNASLRDADPVVARLIDRELRRQQHGLELIASENFASRAVIDAMGTPLTNKYAEGYPGKRYYGGCEVVDEVEQLAIDRLKQLFGAEHANVQPHSGAQANFAAFMALLPPGEKLMGMSLPHGGHLSHGAAVNHSGAIWQAVHYGVDPATGRIDYDQVRDQAQRGAAQAHHRGRQRLRPHHRLRRVPLHRRRGRRHVPGGHGALRRAGGRRRPSLAGAACARGHQHHPQDAARPAGGAHPLRPPSTPRRSTSRSSPARRAGRSSTSSPPRRWRSARRSPTTSSDYARQVVDNAQALAEALIERGFAIVSGGTDTHLMLVDLRPKDLTGKEAEKLLDQAGITVNKNTIPDDPQSPFVTSGIRLGTPALTTRGMGTARDAAHRRADRPRR